MVTEQRSDIPIVMRHVDGAVWLVAGAAGPLGGDDLHLEIVVHDGATLVVRSVAASLVLPDHSGAWSHSHLRVHVHSRATLRWAPQPMIAAAGCRHRSETSIELASDARLCWRDVLVLGRANETPGDVVSTLHVERNSVPVLRQQLRLGPSAPGWASPAVLDRHRATGLMLLVNTDPPPRPEVDVAVRSRVLHLERDALLLTALGDPAAVVATLDLPTDPPGFSTCRPTRGRVREATR